MPEKIPVLPRNNAEHFAIEALVLARKHGVESPDVGRGYVEVTLIVDDQEVPFAETMDVIYDLIYAELDQKAAEKAYASIAGLDGLRDLIWRCETQLRAKIGSVFGVVLKDD